MTVKDDVHHLGDQVDEDAARQALAYLRTFNRRRSCGTHRSTTKPKPKPTRSAQLSPRCQRTWALAVTSATSQSGVSSARVDMDDRMDRSRTPRPAPSGPAGGPAGDPNRRAAGRDGVGGRQATRERTARPSGACASATGAPVWLATTPRARSRSCAPWHALWRRGSNRSANAENMGGGPWHGHQADRGSQAGSSSSTPSRSSSSRQGCRWAQTFC